MRLVKPLRSLYSRLKRRFRVGPGIGKPFQSTNGIIQGCPLSVVLLNLLVNVWARAVCFEAPAALPCGYAEDTGATSTESTPIQQVLDVTGRFATITRQTLNASKSHVWSTSAELQHELDGMSVLGDKVPTTRGGRLLGAHISYVQNMRNDLARKRVQRGVDVAERIRWAPLPMQIRVRLISSLVLPASLYGSWAGCIVSRLLESLTCAVMRAIWGTTRKLRSRDIVLTLFVPGHLVDPRQACVYQCLCALRQHLRKSPELKLVMSRCWEACVLHGQSAPGPLARSTSM